jgi:hypothetical protein
MKTNYLAVVVSAAAYWWLGGLWYGVLFSKLWMALEHISEQQASGLEGLPFLFGFLPVFVAPPPSNRGLLPAAGK